MFKRLKEPSTWAGVGIAGLTAYQQSGNWQFGILALIGALASIFTPEGTK